MYVAVTAETIKFEVYIWILLTYHGLKNTQEGFNILFSPTLHAENFFSQYSMYFSLTILIFRIK